MPETRYGVRDQRHEGLGPAIFAARPTLINVCPTTTKLIKVWHAMCWQTVSQPPLDGDIPVVDELHDGIGGKKTAL